MNLTREQVEAMPAGMEMDLLIAPIAGWDHKHDISECEDCWYDYCRNCGYEPRCEGIDDTDCETPPPYSTDIAAAWEVVEKLMDEGDVFLEWWQDGEWFVADKPMGVREDAITARCDGKTTGKPSAPLAICRAALLARLEE